jgi:hypothetical protein
MTDTDIKAAALRALEEICPADDEAAVAGVISEDLCHLVLTSGLEDGPLGAVARAFGLGGAGGWHRGAACRFHGAVATSDGERLWALRSSSAGKSRSLFSPVTPASCGGSTRTGRSCARCPAASGRSRRGRLVICPAPVLRCPGRAPGWSAKETTTPVFVPKLPRRLGHGPDSG